MRYRNDYRHRARRPSLTPLFTGSLALWLGCALSYSHALAIGANLPDAVALSALLVVLAGLSCIKRKVRSVALLAAFLGAGAMLGFCQAMIQLAATTNVPESSDAVVFKLDEDARTGRFGQSALAQVTLGDGRTMTCKVMAQNSETLYFGESFRCAASFKPSDFSSDAYSWSKGVCATLYASQLEQLEHADVTGLLALARKKVVEAFGAEDDAHATLQAIVCGYRPSISTSPVYSAYQTSGLAHMVAVSGAHLVIVTGLFAAALNALGVSRRFSTVLIILVMLSYLVLAGCPVSAIRATFMSAIGALSPMARRRASSLNALGVGIMAMITWNPVTALSASFALSALATTGIVVFGPLLATWFHRFEGGLSALVTEPLTMLVSANLLAQPYSCSLFGLLPIVSPLANIACSLLFPLVCGFGLIAGLACLSGLPIAGFVVEAAAMSAFAMNTLVSAFASIPFSAVPFKPETHWALVFSAVLAFALWAWWPEARYGVIALAAIPFALMVAFLIPDNRDTITMLDVGQGDSFLLRSRGEVMLVDTGNNDSMLVGELARNRVFEIGNVLVTHVDDDHCGSLDAVAQCANVRTFLLAADMLEESSGKAKDLVDTARGMSDEVVGLEAGDVFRIGAFTCRVVWPRAFADSGGNADSLCIWVDYDGDDDGRIDFTALFTGDAEHGELQHMIDDHEVGRVDLLKVGHHGSRNGMTQAQANVLKPRIALIGVGAHNRYGHPTEEILNMLENEGSEVYRTDEDGEVTCELSPRGAHVFSQAYN